MRQCLQRCTSCPGVPESEQGDPGCVKEQRLEVEACRVHAKLFLLSKCQEATLFWLFYKLSGGQLGCSVISFVLKELIISEILFLCFVD